jgi:hypothetical protein
MLSNLRIYPYIMSSKSARVLRKSLNGLLVYPNRHYKPKERHVILNWGSSLYPNWLRPTTHILNHPFSVAISTNKLKTFEKLKENGVPTPEWTTNKDDLEDWIGLGFTIYCRTLLTSRSGRGIVIAKELEEIVDAPLYTRGITNYAEYRVHVFDGKILDYTQKKRRRNVDSSPHIRNHDNGWVFTRQDVDLPRVVEHTAINAVEALGLDFGAVDIGHIHDAERAFVFEVNSAPGMEGTTLTKYIGAIREHLR